MSTAAESGNDAGYRWPTPPSGGWTADDLDRIPGLPPHTELIDGGLFFVSPQTYFHQAVIRRLENALHNQVPDEYDVVREMTTTLGSRDRPEPDLMVVAYEAFEHLNRTSVDPADVLLAVEVVSKESETRDRTLKPGKYAAAGIRHFWRVEEDGDGSPVVYVYELDPASRAYSVTGIHHGEVKVTVPFPFVVDLSRGALRRARPGAGGG